MNQPGFLSEQQLEQLERRRDPEMVPHLVAAVRQQQHDLDALRLSTDVLRRDRDELRVALLAAHDELRTLRAEVQRLRGQPDG